MKKLILISLVTLVLPACRRTQKIVPPDTWADYRKAYAFWRSNKDSAFFYFNRAAINQGDKEQVALAYYDMSLIQSDAGDHYGAQESLTQSLKSLDGHLTKDRPYLATDYNGLGMALYDLNDYVQALTYDQLALQYADDKSLRPYILNNIGNAYKGLAAYGQALINYQQAIELTGAENSNYARTLTNMATTKWLRDRRYDALPELKRSLAIRLRVHDRLGENSSYAHLADFYMDRHSDSALYYANKMFTIASGLQSPDDELEALRKLIVLSRPAELKAYFRRYQTLSDSLETTRNAAKNQFALIRYNVEKGKTENLQLQKENTKKRYQLTGVLIIVALGSLLTVFWYRKRKQRLQLEAENSIRQNKLMVSQKVHDVVANGLYRVMNEVEYNEAIDRNDLLNKLELMYEQSRDITYEREELPQGDFADKLNRLLSDFKSKSIKLAIVGNETALWQMVKSEIKKQLEPVLQELMVNMNKHSNASQAFIGFESDSISLTITYRDNGIGLLPDVQFGNGLKSTVSRIEALNGNLKFETTAVKGLQLKITIPQV